jgi:hypothetical protein
MASNKKNRAISLLLGPFPAETINRTLLTELEPGDAVLTAGVQKHVLREHPNDFAWCLPHVATVVTNPLYVGDDFKNPGYIEMISRVPGQKTGLLVAVCIKVNGEGQYEVRSFYPVRNEKSAGAWRRVS